MRLTTSLMPWLLTLALLGLSACADIRPDLHDRQAGLAKQDYRNLVGQGLFGPQVETGSDADGTPGGHAPAEPPVDTAAPQQVEKAPLTGPGARPVSVSVTESVPLKDLLFELARQADVDVVIDPAISGGVRLTANNRPLDTVLSIIAESAGLRYQWQDGTLRVERDLPYPVTYRLDLPDLKRNSRSDISSSTDVFSVVNGANGSPRGDNGSNSSIRTETGADFWSVLTGEIAGLIDAPFPAGTDNPRVTVNRQAGLVTVIATKRQHRRVDEYLDRVNRLSSAQVLIEAKVVEVTLDDGYESGINWRTLFNDGANVAARFGATVASGPFSTPTTATANVLTFAVDRGDLGTVLSFVENFGTTRTLSSPRLTVLNNQPAILKVAENHVYFTLDVERETDDDTGDTLVTVSSKINTVPIGLVMTVQPAINPDTGTIIMTTRPTISRITDFVADPGVAIASDTQVESTVPVVEVRELDSILRMHSGEIMVMGGLMEERVSNEEQGIPGLADIPWFGRLFKAETDSTQTVELVIFLRATVLAGSNVAAPDANLYRLYGRDPRPLRFIR